MRLFVVLLIISWLTGHIVGLYQESLAIIGAGIVLVYIVVRARLQLPLGFAVGVVYGLAIIATGNILTSSDICQIDSPIQVIIRQQLKITADKATYIGQTGEGCGLLITSPVFPVLQPGNVVRVEGNIQSVTEIPEEYKGYKIYLTNHDVQATVSWPTIVVIEADVTFTAQIRSRVRRQISSIWSEPTASFIQSLLLAERGALAEDIQEHFRLTGVTHILAVSGLHISLLTAVLLGLLMILPLPRSVRTGIVLVMIWGYVLGIGMPISAVRAAWFWTLFLLFWQQQRLVSLPTVLLLTLLLLVSFRPLIVLDVGFQLSVAAVIGIWGWLFLLRPYRVPVPVLMVTLGATLTTWPIVVYHFGMVSLISLITNLLVVPVVPAVMIVSSVALGISIVTFLGAQVVGTVVMALVYWMRVVTAFLAQIPGAFIENIAIWPGYIFLYYVILVVASFVVLGYQQRSWREVWE